MIGAGVRHWQAGITTSCRARGAQGLRREAVLLPTGANRGFSRGPAPSKGRVRDEDPVERRERRLGCARHDGRRRSGDRMHERRDAVGVRGGRREQRTGALLGGLCHRDRQRRRDRRTHPADPNGLPRSLRGHRRRHPAEHERRRSGGCLRRERERDVRGDNLGGLDRVRSPRSSRSYCRRRPRPPRSSGKPRSSTASSPRPRPRRPARPSLSQSRRSTRTPTS